MGRIIADYAIKPCDGPTYVADHYRAPADMAMHELDKGPLDCILPNCEINDDLNEEKEIGCLVSEYLMPLRGQLDSSQHEAFDEWTPTLVWA